MMTPFSRQVLTKIPKFYSTVPTRFPKTRWSTGTFLWWKPTTRVLETGKADLRQWHPINTVHLAHNFITVCNEAGRYFIFIKRFVKSINSIWFFVYIFKIRRLSYSPFKMALKLQQIWNKCCLRNYAKLFGLNNLYPESIRYIT